MQKKLKIKFISICSINQGAHCSTDLFSLYLWAPLSALHQPHSQAGFHFAMKRWLSKFQEEKTKQNKTTKACLFLGCPNHILRLILPVSVWFPNYLCIQFCGQGRESSLSHMPSAGAGSGVSSTQSTQPEIRGAAIPQRERRTSPKEGGLQVA